MDLQAIEARLKAATPGTWQGQEFVYNPPEDAGTPVIKQGNGGLVAYALRSGAVEHQWYDRPQCDADAEFIAHAPEDIRALIAEVTDLRMKLEAAQFQIEEVKALHFPADLKLYAATIKECATCEGQKWPCPTMRALGVTE